MISNYTGIKKILRLHINKGIRSLWTWDRKENNFTYIYQNYNDKLKIFTAQQLLNEIEEEIKSQKSNTET